MTATDAIIGNKLESVRIALKQEEDRLRELRAIEAALVEILQDESNGSPSKPAAAAPLTGEQTLKEIVLTVLRRADRAVTVPEIIKDAGLIKGKAVRRQGVYSTLHEMSKRKEAKRVRPGLYRAMN